MTTRHQAALDALETLLAGACTARVEIADALPEDCPPEGLVMLVGQPWELIGRQLSPPRREYERPIDLQIVVTGQTTAARDAALDAIFVQIGAALDGEKLGGLVDYINLAEPELIAEIPMQGAASLKGAALPAVLSYQTSDNQMEQIP